MDYSGLKIAIADWMARSDLTAYLDTFIDNAEARFNFGTDEDAPFPSKPIRVRDMITSSDLTLTGGSVALPATFIEAVRVTAITEPRRKLEYATPDWLDEIYPSTSASDPVFYTVLGANLIVRPTTSSQVELQFYQKIPAISVATTNWLSLNSSNVYLYGSLLEASVFIQNIAMAQQMYALMKGAIGGLVRTDMRSTSGTQPSRRTSGAVA